MGVAEVQVQVLPEGEVREIGMVIVRKVKPSGVYLYYVRGDRNKKNQIYLGPEGRLDPERLVKAMLACDERYSKHFENYARDKDELARLYGTTIRKG